MVILSLHHPDMTVASDQEQRPGKRIMSVPRKESKCGIDVLSHVASQ